MNKLWYNNTLRGADLKLRQQDLNILLCKPIDTVSIILIANFVAKAKSAVATIAQAFRAPVFAPALV